MIKFDLKIAEEFIFFGLSVVWSLLGISLGGGVSSKMFSGSIDIS